MKNETLKISIDEGFSDYLEKLTYEVGARKDLLSFMIESKMNSELFNEYHDEYLEIYAEYQIAKQKLEEEYIKPFMEDGKVYDWDLNFHKKEVYVNAR